MFGAVGDTAVNADIKKVVDILDQRIANLQNIKLQLLEEFGGESASTVVVAARPVQQGNGSRTRIQQLRDFLLQHGPAKRAEIIAGAGMPKGTIASLLNREDFVRRSDGKWQVDVEPKAV